MKLYEIPTGIDKLLAFFPLTFSFFDPGTYPEPARIVKKGFFFLIGQNSKFNELNGLIPKISTNRAFLFLVLYYYLGQREGHIAHKKQKKERVFNAIL